MVNSNIIHIRSISELHAFYNCGKSKHPLVSVIDLTTLNPTHIDEPYQLQMDLYIVSCKQIQGALNYGRTHYDFTEGSLIFTAPGQVLSTESDVKIEKGWALFFHPDLLYSSTLGQNMHQCSFFLYNLNEALHVSDEELLILEDGLRKIRREYEQNTDRHTMSLIVDNIELILKYSQRFYDRQFFTREKSGKDLIQQFERLLNSFFSDDNLTKNSLPDVDYFASRLNLSGKYLSDLLKRFTGKTTQEHIHWQLIEKAKSLLLGTDNSVSEIAYSLGFDHASHFTKIFKSKTGTTPTAFRNLN